MFIDKGLELYQQACRHGLSVSLSINHLNGQESFSLTTILVQIWQTCQNTGGVPEEDEDPDKMVFIPNRSEGQAQPNQLLSHPLMPLLPDCRCPCFSLLLLSILVLLLSMLLLPTLPRNSPDQSSPKQDPLTKLPRALLVLLPACLQKHEDLRIWAPHNIEFDIAWPKLWHKNCVFGEIFGCSGP